MAKLIFHLVLVVLFYTTKVSAAETCSPNPGLCWAVGDPHIRRFDGSTISFSTTGNTLLVSDDATVEISTDIEATGDLNQVSQVYITFNYNGKETRIVLSRGRSDITVNGVSHTITPENPYNLNGVSIRAISTGLVIDGDEVNVKWLSGSKLYLTVGQKYHGTLSGQCGDYCTISGE